MPEENKSPTPEQDLLKIIEAKKGARSQPQAIMPQALRQAKSYVSAPALKARTSYLKNSLKGLAFPKLKVNFHTVNTLLVVLLCAVIIGLVSDFASSLLGMSAEVEAAFMIDSKAKEFSFPEIISLQNSSYYLDKARSRNLFDIVADEVARVTVIEGGQPVQAHPTVLVTKAESLRLVGISWSKDPDAMIEDTNSKRTFFVKRGDMVNDLQISAIFKDKVVLSYRGEEVELK